MPNISFSVPFTLPTPVLTEGCALLSRIMINAPGQVMLQNCFSYIMCLFRTFALHKALSFVDLTKSRFRFDNFTPSEAVTPERHKGLLNVRKYGKKILLKREDNKRARIKKAVTIDIAL